MAVKNDPINDAEAAEQELKRGRLLEFLNRDKPAGRDEDHSDIVALGAADMGASLAQRKERAPEGYREEIHRKLRPACLSRSTLRAVLRPDCRGRPELRRAHPTGGGFCR